MNYELGVNVKEGPKYPGKNYVPWRLIQSNHGGVVTFHGKDYLFYHTSALSPWRKDRFKNKGNWTQRSVSVDEIRYNEDGSIIPVQQTLASVGPLKINQPFEKELTNRIKFTDKNPVHGFENIDLGSGYYYFDAVITSKLENISGRLEIRLDREDGYLAGTIQLPTPNIETRKGRVDTFLREAHGKRNIFVKFIPDNDNTNLTLKAARVFAGSPLTKPLAKK